MALYREVSNRNTKTKCKKRCMFKGDNKDIR